MGALAIQTSLVPGIAVEEVHGDIADDLLTRWGHYLGACDRPFGKQSVVLTVNGQPTAVAVSASTVSATVAGYDRQQVVELARLCSAPGANWATRVMLRLWREVTAPSWRYWPPAAAVAYSKNDRHDGRIYRFDGWTKVTDSAGSSGGGTWTRQREPGAAATGAKTLWIWRYDARPAAVAPPTHTTQEQT